MFYVLIALAAILLCAVVAARRTGASETVRRKVEQAPADDPDIADLAIDDPIEALLRYGTPADAERLEQQGIDLGALGHRPNP